LRDLPALNPNQETYQLWIVDEAQNKKTPVSGGIFNVGQAGEAIIPINAQLKIVKPKSFAVSKEKAGGVPVTKPDRIVAIAKL
jgi:anti-sigma-K factor RskA